MRPAESAAFVVLSGGVGGGKFAAGLNDVLGPGELAVVVNTGDDFDHLGLRICPDLDSVTYALAGLGDEKRGWGRDQETWNCMQTLGQLGAEDWFALGDKDLGLHLFRTHGLRDGSTLAEISSEICRRLGIQSHVIPMAEAPVQTILDTDQGMLSFQDYFVKSRCEPRVRTLSYRGAARANLHAQAQAALRSRNLKAIFIAPSNPFLSIDPILALPGVRELIASRGLPVIAISPLIQGQALKGPLSKMLESLGVPGTAAGIAQHYKGLVNGMVIDVLDQAQAQDLAIATCITPTRMTGQASRRALAQAALEFAMGGVNA